MFDFFGTFMEHSADVGAYHESARTKKTSAGFTLRRWINLACCLGILFKQDATHSLHRWTLGQG